MPSIWDWSTTASNNSNSDSGINWAEGQAPSTVNNSARVMMARLKEFLNDLSGVATATGTASAMALTASSAFTAYADGIRVSFKAAATNTGSTTLNVNAIGAKTIVKMTSYGESALSGGEIQEDGIYEFVYSTILNGAAGAWLILNPSNVDVAPPGFGGPYFGGSVPSGWLLCNGAAISRTTYSRLFTAIGTTWGGGDGSTTFNLPDGRDDYIRGASATLTVGTRQTDSVKSHTHPFSATTGSGGSHTHSVTISTGTGGSRITGGASSPAGTSTTDVVAGGEHTHTVSGTTDSTGDTETRPRSIVANWIIKY